MPSEEISRVRPTSAARGRGLKQISGLIGERPKYLLIEATALDQMPLRQAIYFVAANAPAIARDVRNVVIDSRVVMKDPLSY